MKSYLEALSKNPDPDAMREGLKLTEPNSIAYVYLNHQANVSEAGLDAGQPFPKEDVTAVAGDAFKVCSDPTDETTCDIFGNFKINAAAKLVDLTVDKQPVGPRLTAGNGQTVTAGGAKFTFLTAYKTISSNDLFVTVRVETSAKAITLNSSGASYRGPDGKQRIATSATGATDIIANSNTIVAIAFAGVKVGGRVTLGGWVGQNASGGEFTAVMQVG